MTAPEPRWAFDNPAKLAEAAAIVRRALARKRAAERAAAERAAAERAGQA